MWKVKVSLVWRAWQGNGYIRARKLLKAAERQFGLRARSIDMDEGGIIVGLELTTTRSEEYLKCRLDDLAKLATHSYDCQLSIIGTYYAVHSSRRYNRSNS